MYRCEICAGVSLPGQLQLKHAIYRESVNKQKVVHDKGWEYKLVYSRNVVKEMVVCPTCKGLLTTHTLGQVQELRQEHREVNSARQAKPDWRKADEKPHRVVATVKPVDNVVGLSNIGGVDVQVEEPPGPTPKVRKPRGKPTKLAKPKHNAKIKKARDSSNQSSSRRTR